MKACPFCAEQIQDAAVVCRFCNRQVVPVLGPQTADASRNARMKSPGRRVVKYLLVGVGIFFTLTVLLVVVAVNLIPAAQGNSQRAASGSPAAASTTGSAPRPRAPISAAPSAGPAPTTAPPSGAAQQSPRRSYTPAQIAAAHGVMEKVSAGLAKLDDDGHSLDVRFAYGLLPGMNREQIYQLIEAIANADATLTGESRLILFYDPTGKRVGKASAVSGITVDMK